MSSTKQLPLALALLTSLCPAALAAPTQQAAAQVKSAKKKKETKPNTCQGDKDCYVHSRFQIGPYLNKDRLFDGSELVINTPTVREDARLLLRENKLIQDCAALGMPLPKFPRLEISGKVEGLLSYVNPYQGKSDTDFLIDGAELDLYAQATSWLSAYLAVDYTQNPGPDAKSHIFMNRAFVTLGNLAITPFYVSLGKEYVPFGRYASNMIDAPATLVLGRTLANTVVFGYQQTGYNALHAEAYLYQGKTHYQEDGKKNHLEYGGDIGYAYRLGAVSGEIGGGVISNISDSAGFHGDIFNNSVTFITQRIPGADVYGSLAYKQWNLIAEYVSAMRRFNKDNVAFKNRGAEPSALNTELSYNFKTFNKPSSIAFGYSRSWQALALGLPKNSYRLVYNINIWRNTNLAVEYEHNLNYSKAAGVGTGVDSSQLGKQANTVLVAFDYFF